MLKRKIPPDTRLRRITPYESLYLSMERAFPPFAIELKIELVHPPKTDDLARALAEAAHANPGARMRASRGWWWDSRRPPEVVSIAGKETWSLQHPALQRRLAGEQGPPMELLRWEGVGLIFRCTHALMDAAGLLFFAQETFRALRGESLLGSLSGLNDWSYLSSSPHRRPLSGMKAEWPSLLGPARGTPAPHFLHEMRKILGRVDSPAARVAACIARIHSADRTAQSCKIMMPVDLRLEENGLRTTCNLSNPLILTFDAESDSKACWREVLSALGRHEQFGMTGWGAALAWLPPGPIAHAIGWMHTRHVARGRHFFSALSSNLARVRLESFRYEASVPESVAFLPFDTPGAGLSLLTVQHDGALEVAASCPAAYGGDGRLARFLDDLCAELGRGAAVRQAGICQGQAREQEQASPKIAVAASFVAEPIGKLLAHWMQTFGLSLTPKFAPYGQVFQALNDPVGVFLSNRDGINLVLLRLEDLHRSAPRSDGETMRVRLHKNVGDFLSALERAAASSAVPIIVWLAPFSKRAMKEGEIFAMIDPLQELIENRLRQMQDICFLSDEEVRGWYPVAEEEAPLADTLGHAPFSRERYGAIASAFARKIVALHVPPLKVIVVDCDNTLWQGVCGEVGPDGVRVTANHRALQEFLLRQIDAGMLLCLCSRNEPADVDAVFARCNEMLLRSEHVVARRINWRPKSENIMSLADELNLGLDSFVFLDDNPVECAEVESHCRGVQVIRIPDDAEQIASLLQHVWMLDRPTMQDRALPRTQMYRQNDQRESLRTLSKDFQEFLQSLELQVVIAPPEPHQWERIAELSRRTNQFNVHPEPRQAGYFRTLEPTAHCLAVDVQDRFGAYGLTGFVIYRQHEGTLCVDAWLLSCRVLGRGVEHRVLARLGEIALQSGSSEIVFSYRSTAKNTPVRAFLDSVCEPLPTQHGIPGERYRINAQAARKSEPCEVKQSEIMQREGAPSEVSPAAEGADQSEPHMTSSALLPSGVLNLVASLRRSVTQILEATENPYESTQHASVDSKCSEMEAELLSIANSITGGALRAASPDDSLVDLGVDSLQIVMLLDEAARKYIPGMEEILFGAGLEEFLVKPTIRELAIQLQRLAANAGLARGKAA